MADLRVTRITRTMAGARHHLLDQFSFAVTVYLSGFRRFRLDWTGAFIRRSVSFSAFNVLPGFGDNHLV
jgi:hypothetical protein